MLFFLESPKWICHGYAIRAMFVVVIKMIDPTRVCNELITRCDREKLAVKITAE